MNNLEGLIDNKNINLWKEVCKAYEIVIQKEDRIDYAVWSENEKSVIYVPENNLSSSSFTHELLHIYLKTKKVFVGGGLTLSVKENLSLSKIFSEDLLDHISNCLEHTKMIPIFLDLGYKIDEFISDYHENKLTNENLSILRSCFKLPSTFSAKYNAACIDYYIAKYFAAKACPNPVFDYYLQINELKHIDPDLFNILESFWESWINYDYDELHSSYHSFLFDFTDGLERWVEDKVIITLN